MSHKYEVESKAGEKKEVLHGLKIKKIFENYNIIINYNKTKQ